jgi:hypothetical protein
LFENNKKKIRLNNNNKKKMSENLNNEFCRSPPHYLEFPGGDFEENDNILCPIHPKFKNDNNTDDDVDSSIDENLIVDPLKNTIPRYVSYDNTVVSYEDCELPVNIRFLKHVFNLAGLKLKHKKISKKKGLSIKKIILSCNKLQNRFLTFPEICKYVENFYEENNLVKITTLKNQIGSNLCTLYNKDILIRQGRRRSFSYKINKNESKMKKTRPKKRQKTRPRPRKSFILNHQK